MMAILFFTRVKLLFINQDYKQFKKYVLKEESKEITPFTGKGILEQIDLSSIHPWEPWKYDLLNPLITPKEAYKRKRIVVQTEVFS